jgi:hypothetical protein
MRFSSLAVGIFIMSATLTAALPVTTNGNEVASSPNVKRGPPNNTSPVTTGDQTSGQTTEHAATSGEEGETQTTHGGTKASNKGLPKLTTNIPKKSWKDNPLPPAPKLKPGTVLPKDLKKPLPVWAPDAGVPDYAVRGL